MLNWTALTITNEQEYYSMVETFTRNKAIIIAGAFDTEADGLNIIIARPFLFQFGFCCSDGNGYTFAVDLELYHDIAVRTITMWNYFASTLEYYLGHNIKFDLHMSINIGLPYNAPNVSDTMTWIRLGTDAIPERKGGAPLGLKKFAKRYVSEKARTMDERIQTERAEIAANLNMKLKRRLNWTKKQIDEFFKDKIHEKEDLPDTLQHQYEEWYALDLPLYLQGVVRGAVDKDDIPYNQIDRAVVTHYGHLDIVWTLETFMTMLPVVQLRGNLSAIEREDANIYPLVAMERVGFTVDAEYIYQARKDMKQYIIQRRKDLCAQANRQLKASQNAVVLNLFKEWGIDIPSTEAEVLSRRCSDLKHTGEAEHVVEFIETLQELRTLEKWYSTYICRFIRELRVTKNKLYTTINQAGTVSGRVTSDFQQFPKDSIKTLNGVEIFSPRRMVLTKTGDFIGTVYLDYSQIELRLQAMYTILVGHPDLNLCRAYMPYKCHAHINNVKKTYDYNELWCTKNANSIVWYYDEEPDKQWTPTDVHGATTKIAFHIDESDPRFHDLRYKGKRVNFAKNYGAQFDKIKEMFPEYDDETIAEINDAYYKAFPGVKAYHTYCYNMANTHAYMQNLFGVRYYGASGHNLINMLIQGTGAYFLKWKITQVHEYLRKNKCKSTVVMQIHDELQLMWHKDDNPQIFFDIKAIMEEWDDTLVPIVADMELSTTSWVEKYEVEKVEDFYEH